MKTTTMLKMMVMPWGHTKMLRKEQEALERYGAVPVPGESSVTLPEGKVVVSYRESIKAGSDEDHIYFDPPASLQIEIRPAGGGEPLELKMAISDSTSVTGGDSPRSTTNIGTVQATPGEYVVTVNATESDLVEPAVLLG